MNKIKNNKISVIFLLIAILTSIITIADIIIYYSGNSKSNSNGTYYYINSSYNIQEVVLSDNVKKELVNIWYNSSGLETAFCLNGYINNSIFYVKNISYDREILFANRSFVSFYEGCKIFGIHTHPYYFYDENGYHYADMFSKRDIDTFINSDLLLDGIMYGVENNTPLLRIYKKSVAEVPVR